MDKIFLIAKTAKANFEIEVAAGRLRCFFLFLPAVEVARITNGRYTEYRIHLCFIVYYAGLSFFITHERGIYEN